MKQDHWYKVSNPIQIQANHVHHTHCNSNEALVHSLRINMFLLHNPSNSFTQSSLDAMLQRSPALWKTCSHGSALHAPSSDLNLDQLVSYKNHVYCIQRFFSWFWLQVVGIITPYKAIHTHVYIYIYQLVVSSHLKHISSNCIISRNRVKNKICLKPPPRHTYYLHADNANWCLLAATKPTSRGQFFHSAPKIKHWWSAFSGPHCRLSVAFVGRVNPVTIGNNLLNFDLHPYAICCDDVWLTVVSSI